VFFVSVASKELSWGVSLLFATLAGRTISVAAKGLKAIVGSGQWTVVIEWGNGV
jgi:short subunit fatty acids transporter